MTRKAPVYCIANTKCSKKGQFIVKMVVNLIKLIYNCIT